MTPRPATTNEQPETHQLHTTHNNNHAHPQYTTHNLHKHTNGNTTCTKHTNSMTTQPPTSTSGRHPAATSDCTHSWGSSEAMRTHSYAQVLADAVCGMVGWVGGVPRRVCVCVREREICHTHVCVRVSVCVCARVVAGRHTVAPGGHIGLRRVRGRSGRPPGDL